MSARLGPYELLQEVGYRGMGSVYLGRRVGLGGFHKWVAIKTIHPHLAKEAAFVTMFLDEARTADTDTTSATTTNASTTSSSTTNASTSTTRPSAMRNERTRSTESMSTPSSEPSTAPEPAPSTAPSNARATLSLLTEPWATVRIGGRDYGRTPLFAREVPAGRLQIELRARGEGDVVSRTVNAAPGEAVSLRVTLPDGSTPSEGDGRRPAITKVERATSAT